MVELADGTRKLLSELAGAEAAAGFRFRPDLPWPYGSESGRLVSLSCHHHDGWAHTLGHTPQNSSRTIARPVDDKRQQRARLSGGEAVVHIQRSGYGLPVNDRSGGASKGLL